jgi:hypothetical protein
MPQKVTVQALRDIKFSPPLNKGEYREFSVLEARVLVATGLARLANRPGRPKKETQ